MASLREPSAREAAPTAYSAQRARACVQGRMRCGRGRGAAKAAEPRTRLGGDGVKRPCASGAQLEEGVGAAQGETGHWAALAGARGPSEVVHLKPPDARVAIVVEEPGALVLGHQLDLLAVPLPGLRILQVRPAIRRPALVHRHGGGLVEALPGRGLHGLDGVDEDLAHGQVHQPLDVQASAIRRPMEDDAADTRLDDLEVADAAQLVFAHLLEGRGQDEGAPRPRDLSGGHRGRRPASGRRLLPAIVLAVADEAARLWQLPRPGNAGADGAAQRDELHGGGALLRRRLGQVGGGQQAPDVAQLDVGDGREVQRGQPVAEAVLQHPPPRGDVLWVQRAEQHRGGLERRAHRGGDPRRRPQLPH
eukprot:CAMPEP_0176226726 /NCGR_PEP_ID=MMETSP0121_2-20121125/22406_1 /TAXON_ID=160619 /ORGANISM="Kryptoperidinium foliaceum, Strain CCMP 1326" /LENGTH=362 /DNA_ID=CAMNT_0017565995 /DNA_START=44 /DNA_END=1129 /DNA_ORIENTATION=+